MATPKLLAIYLQDHHAGASAGLAVARRAAGSNEGTEYGAELERIAAELEQDKEALERVMEELDVGRDFVKDNAAWVGEKVGRLKLNGRIREYSPLSRLLEIEGLVIGITGKLGLWRALREAHGERIGGVSIEEYAARAEDQRSRLEPLRLRAAREALDSD